MKNNRICGAYIRKRGEHGKYMANHGWHRKWTYKVCYVGSNDKLMLVAMTDGMTIGNHENSYFTPKALNSWMNKHDMVLMSHNEIVKFIFYDINATNHYRQTNN